MSDLIIACMLAGTNLDGGRDVTGYELEATTRGTRQTSWRKTTASGRWVEGDYDVSAVRGNITEVLAVYVYGAENNQLAQRISWLVDHLASPSFPISWASDGMVEVWDCSFADYTITAGVELQHATQALVQAQVPRRPSVTRTYANGSVYIG